MRADLDGSHLPRSYYLLRSNRPRAVGSSSNPRSCRRSARRHCLSRELPGRWSVIRRSCTGTSRQGKRHRDTSGRDDEVVVPALARAVVVRRVVLIVAIRIRQEFEGRRAVLHFIAAEKLAGSVAQLNRHPHTSGCGVFVNVTANSERRCFQSGK